MTFYMPFLKTRLSFDKKYLIDHAFYYIFNLKQYLQHRFFFILLYFRSPFYWIKLVFTKESLTKFLRTLVYLCEI